MNRYGVIAVAVVIVALFGVMGVRIYVLEPEIVEVSLSYTDTITQQGTSITAYNYWGFSEVRTFESDSEWIEGFNRECAGAVESSVSQINSDNLSDVTENNRRFAALDINDTRYCIEIPQGGPSQAIDFGSGTVEIDRVSSVDETFKVAPENVNQTFDMWRFHLSIEFNQTLWGNLQRLLPEAMITLLGVILGVAVGYLLPHSQKENQPITTNAS